MGQGRRHRCQQRLAELANLRVVPWPFGAPQTARGFQDQGLDLVPGRQPGRRERIASDGPDGALRLPQPVLQKDGVVVEELTPDGVQRDWIGPGERGPDRATPPELAT